MQILDNLIILLLVVLAFVAGLLVAGNYYRQMLAQHQYTEKILAADKGLGYLAPPQKKLVPIGQQFMDKLKETGRATQQLRGAK